MDANHRNVITAFSESKFPTIRSKRVLNAKKAIEIYKEKLVLSKTSSFRTPPGGSQIIPLAKRFGVSPKTIRDIWNRKTWTFETLDLWAEEHPDQANTELLGGFQAIQVNIKSSRVAFRCNICHQLTKTPQTRVKHCWLVKSNTKAQGKEPVHLPAAVASDRIPLITMPASPPASESAIREESRRTRPRSAADAPAAPSAQIFPCEGGGRAAPRPGVDSKRLNPSMPPAQRTARPISISDELSGPRFSIDDFAYSVPGYGGGVGDDCSGGGRGADDAAAARLDPFHFDWPFW